MRCFLKLICNSTTDKRSKAFKSGSKRHFFRAPKNEERLKIWQDAISSSGCESTNILKSKDSLCHLHFKNEDIQWDFPEVKMPDGTTFLLKREKPVLKKTAVPSVFKRNFKKKVGYAFCLKEHESRLKASTALTEQNK